MTYVIAEIGNNHNGSIKKAKQLVKEAVNSGVDAIKTQSFRGLDIVSPKVLMSDLPDWDDGKFKYWYQFAEDLALPLENHQELIDFTNSLSVDFITTPVSVEILEELESLTGIRAYKVASMDLTNTNLLIEMSKTNKPIILSTGMGSEKEIERAVSIFKNSDLTLLHCVSDYPLNPQNAFLGNIKILKETYNDLKIGFSDHSLSHELSIAAVSLGAEVIEKHFTLNRNDEDRAEHHMSMEPDEFSILTQWIKVLDNNIAQENWGRSEIEESNKEKSRRSFHYKTNLTKGHRISLNDLAFVRPGKGIGYEHLNKILDKKLVRPVYSFNPCLLSDFES
tara:strand:- start:10677 stop:11684 length:1008 start_codon:yes stop_codon:yes gene_type:complete